MQQSNEAADRSVISEHDPPLTGRGTEQKVPYPKEYNLVPVRRISKAEERAIKELERLKKKREEILEKV